MLVYKIVLKFESGEKARSNTKNDPRECAGKTPKNNESVKLMLKELNIIPLI